MKINSSQILEKESLEILKAAIDRLETGFTELPKTDPQTSNRDKIENVIFDVAEQLKDNYPYFHPLYAGQMLMPPHPVARIAYALAMWINPNNHALDGGRASSRMEKEAVSDLARMFGFEKHLGHLTGGGTMANLEALWVAGKIRPGAKIAASEQAHYTHNRISNVLGLSFETVACDRFGRMDVEELEKILQKGNVGTVVATIGTTAVGSVDPLEKLLALRERYGFRLHADAAYGGYFRLADNLDGEARRAFDRLSEVDSIVIDPHKHGLQPYGCGCVLFSDSSVGRFYKHDSPYTYFSSLELHLGEISLECSRPGAAAVGLWATHKLFPLVKGGEFSEMKTRSRAAALELYNRLLSDKRFIVPFPPELDIVVWIPKAKKASEASKIARSIFDQAAGGHLHLALAKLPISFFDLSSVEMECDQETVTCLRSVLMKPDHFEWIEHIWQILDDATTTVLNQ